MTQKHYSLLFALSNLQFQNVGAHFEKWNAGVLGLVMLNGPNEGMRNISRQKWSYKIHIKDVINLRYHVPRSWLKASENLMVVFEEWGGDPTGVSIVRRTTASVYSSTHNTLVYHNMRKF
ncbi:hypothetical protein Dsin_015207 [Dipteronia sinensis]|uniref:Uncharacterized protein n=1 Tax=Dipteronia sinensis TaxID=43782 RepID=A0AAE0E4C2_9ROSI|nr:hypothetical protein Dsin_015207 [Dipteronia sinensis]